MSTHIKQFSISEIETESFTGCSFRFRSVSVFMSLFLNIIAHVLELISRLRPYVQCDHWNHIYIYNIYFAMLKLYEIISKLFILLNTYAQQLHTSEKIMTTLHGAFDVNPIRFYLCLKILCV